MIRPSSRHLVWTRSVLTAAAPPLVPQRNGVNARTTAPALSVKEVSLHSSAVFFKKCYYISAWYQAMYLLLKYSKDVLFYQTKLGLRSSLDQQLKGDFRTTTNGRLDCSKDRITHRSAIQAAATLDRDALKDRVAQRSPIQVAVTLYVA
ncbi:hypothetical protein J6590_023589 [Homalodisca vitripennis]|nr:hypothetical protein J6590_023589 [Homalodisca vitripennis]